MSTGILTVMILLAALIIVVYKRQMLANVFSYNAAARTEEFCRQMEATADQAVKRLEDQMTQLEYLLEEADARILKLESQLRQAERTIEQLSAGSRQPDILQSAAATAVVNEAAQPPVIEPASAISQPDGNRFKPIAQDKREQIMLMHRQGYAIVDIAKATSMGKGEVMLVLDLNKKK